MAKKQKQVHRVEFKNLRNYWGWAYPDENRIELSHELKGYSFLLYALHEHFHLKHPEWSETRVKNESRKTARFIWQMGFRWVDL